MDTPGFREQAIALFEEWLRMQASAPDDKVWGSDGVGEWWRGEAA